MLTPVERPSRISMLGFTIFIAWCLPRASGLLQRYVAGCDATSRRAARPAENASETPAGRQADGKFTLPSRFALYYLGF
jgi:hypothetical protein